jgi:hypothetical protein
LARSLLRWNRERRIAMARKKGPLDELKAHVRKARREAEDLVGKVARDVRMLAARSRAEIEGDVRRLEKDARRRTESAVRDLEARGSRLVTSVEKRAARTARSVLKTFGAPTRGELTALARRLDSLEERLTAVERRGSNVSSAA